MVINANLGSAILAREVETLKLANTRGNLSRDTDLARFACISARDYGGTFIRGLSRSETPLTVRGDWAHLAPGPGT